MAVKIRLSRRGAKKRPYYSIIVADSRAPRDGKYLEKVGTHNPLLPKDHVDRVKLDIERIEYWLSKGAQATDRVMRFLDAAGVAKRKARNNPIKGKAGAKALERVEEKKGKAAAAIEAIAEAKAAAEAAANAPEPVEESPVEDVAVEAVSEEVAVEAAPEEEKKTEESA